MMQGSGRVGSAETGSRKPDPISVGSGPSGFDPARIRGWLQAMRMQGEDRIWRGADETLRYVEALERKCDGES